MYPSLFPLSVLQEQGSRKVDVSPEGGSMLEANHSLLRPVPGCSGSMVTKLLGAEEPAQVALGTRNQKQDFSPYASFPDSHVLSSTLASKTLQGFNTDILLCTVVHIWNPST